MLERETERERDRETERQRDREREGTVEPPKAGTQIQRTMWKILSVRRKVCWRERQRERERGYSRREKEREREREGTVEPPKGEKICW